MDRRRDPGKSKTDLANLRALSAMRPRTKSGQVVWAWPEIQASLNSGWNLREIWEALQLDGIVMSYDQFRVYVSRTRKRLTGQTELVAPSRESTPERNRRVLRSLDSHSDVAPKPSNPHRDPLANIRQEQEKKRTSGFQYNPVSEDHDETVS